MSSQSQPRRLPREHARLHLAACAALTLATAGVAWASDRAVCCPNYELAQETTLEGVIEKVETRYGQAGSPGIHLVVRAGETVYDVHVGPRRYYRRQGIELAAGDAITLVAAPVRGVTSVPEAPQEVVARSIRRGDETLVLREPDGAPRWRQGAT
jgi:hypothetical protein